MSEYLVRQLEEVRTAVKNATLNAERPPDSAKLIAVSKTFPVEDILAAFHAGQLHFGENKAQELEQKAPLLPKEIEWHFIGHIQSNKSAKVLQYASWIHSVNSLKLLKRLERQAGELGKRPNILLEVNISGETNKTGATVANTETMLKTAVKCKNLRVVGLMTMPPFDASTEELHRIFSALRVLRDDWQKKYEIELPELSMGMSGDFITAIAEGSTMVRIGTAIFGKRDYDKT
ncbi:MAG: YggS family pyridoxal phosphate-dependent enzyme [Victivallaceae bacterium]|nr:YggS family pyridoxal phosphate-dependent enzyme [Victivallaceae bacterium]